MFSPLAKGNGSWQGYLEEEHFTKSTFDSLLPSIYRTSIPKDAKIHPTDALGLSKTQDNAIELPKTYLTRRGAILLFAAQKAKQNEREKQYRTDESAKNESLTQDSPAFNNSCQLQSSPFNECVDGVQEKIPPAEKRKLLLEFLDVFLKDPTTNKQEICRKPEDKTENIFGVLSRPKSITSFYKNSESVVKRQNARPKTVPANVIPKEPEQPKAHPRITSGKPRPPVRALGKLPSKNTRTEFHKEKTSNLVTANVLQPPSTEGQCKTPNCSTTNETIQEDRISIPRPNSQCHLEPSERAVSRATSSVSRYSTWWTMDDVSLSYYDNELQDGDENYPECVECLSEQRSEVSRLHDDDDDDDGSEDEDENGEQRTSRNWASKRDVQQPVALNASSKAGFGETDSSTLRNVLYERSYPGHPSKNRVKSAPCIAKRRESKYSPRFSRKTLSAGPKRRSTPTLLPEEHKKSSSMDMAGNYPVRIPSATSCHSDYEGEETFSESNTDISEIPTANQSHTNSGVLEENDDNVLTNEGPAAVSVTSYPGLSFASRVDEGSGHEDKIAEPSSVNDELNFETVENFVETAHRSEISRKALEQDDSLESDLVQLQISEINGPSKTGSQVHQLSKIEDGSVDVDESKSIEKGNRIKMETNEDVALSPEVTSGRDDRELNTQRAEMESPVKETKFKEKLSIDTVSATKREYDAIETEDISETSFHGEVVQQIAESSRPVGVQNAEAKWDTDNLIENTDSWDTDSLEDLNFSEININTVDSDVHESQLFSEAKLEKDELVELVETRQPSTPHLSNDDDSIGHSVHELTAKSRDVSQPIMRQEFEDTHLKAAEQEVSEQGLGTNVSAKQERLDIVAKIKESSVIQQNNADKPSTEPKSKDKTRNKTNDDSSSNQEKAKGPKVGTEKTKPKKLDVQGVGKAENKMTEAKERIEIKAQTKVDLSDLVAKKGSNKAVKKPTVGRKARSQKTARKNTASEPRTPEPEPSLDVIPTIDENVLKMIENQDGVLELSEETLNQFAPVEDFQDPQVLSVLKSTSNKTTDSFSPSKVKKGGKKAASAQKKKGKVIESNVVENEKRKKVEEQKAKQEEEMKLLKEREEEQRRSMEKAKEKQRTIEEEREKRVAQETEVRKQEEEAEKALKEAKKKAKEEREKRREEEAERRRKEVQRRREEKRKRELEIQKREEELEKQRVDREQRMAELQAQKEREIELERIAEEQRQEEERRRLLQLEEEKRQEEEKIREAEEAVQRMAREREYREQMRKIAEAQQAKLEKQEMERRAKEAQERAAIEEERRRLEHEAQMRENEERERVRELRQKEAIARIRAAHEASRRRAWALRRRAQNTERMSNLRFTRQAQKLTEAFTFSYHVHVPREIWVLPYDWNSKKKRGFRPRKKKTNREKKA